MPFGFVVIRHINSEQTNKYWIECLRCIRKHYPFEKILIIDDNSDPKFLNSNGVNMTNVEIVQSEFPKRGELLGYYYFHKLKPFEKGIILHDSAFIQRRINFENINLAFLWSFQSTFFSLVDGKILTTNDDPENDTRLLSYLKNSQPLLEKYKSEQFNGCFGVMSVIHSTVLDYFVEKYDLFKLLEHVNTRKLRMNVERVFGVICSLETNNNVPTICGDIFNHPSTFSLDYDMYKDMTDSLYRQEKQRTLRIFKLKAKNPLLDYPIFKVWTGR